MPIMVVIMGTPSATSPWAAVGLAATTIPVTACFCSTMRAVVIRCANDTAVIGSKGGIIDIVSTEAVIGVLRTKQSLAWPVNLTNTEAEWAIVMTTGVAAVDIIVVETMNQAVGSGLRKASMYFPNRKLISPPRMALDGSGLAENGSPTVPISAN